jgi:hypothetical protein
MYTGEALVATALKYGRVGAGFVAKFHLAALRQLRGMELAGVTALKGGPELAAMAREWGVGQTVVYESIAETAKLLKDRGSTTRTPRRRTSPPAWSPAGTRRPASA